MGRPQSGFLIAAGLLFTSSLFDLVMCPYSKVEESFQLQATHDLYYHGIGYAIQEQYSHLSNTTASTTLPYDHLQYPGGRLDVSRFVFQSVLLVAHAHIHIIFCFILRKFEVVPRTFTGPLILSYLCRILLLPLSIVNIDVNPNSVQFLARLCLLVLNFVGWLRLALAVDRMPLVSHLSVLRKNKKAITEGSWLLLITACQFHIPYYSSRMLPNVFALVIVLHSYSCWLEKKVKIAAALIVFGTLVFRCDLLLLLGSIGLSWIFQRELSVPSALKIGIITGILSLIITTPFDSILWQRPVWPEGQVFYFNTILGKSKEWGLSPWHWYFTNALPKAMLLTIFLVPLSIFRITENLVVMEKKWKQSLNNSAKKKGCDGETIWIDKQWLRFLIPVIGFVLLYSLLGHKEIRFIFPALPMLNLGAAIGMSKLTQLAFPPRLPSKGKEYFVSSIGRIGFGSGLMLMGFTFAGSLIFVFVSKENYSGGDALRELSLHIQSVVSKSEDSVLEKISPHVYIDVAAAMSGVSLFGQRAAQAMTPNVYWTFNKGGYEEKYSVLRQAINFEQFTHLLSEDRNIVSTSKFTVIHAQRGKPRLDLQKRKIVTEDAIFVFERNGWGSSSDP